MLLGCVRTTSSVRSLYSFERRACLGHSGQPLPECRESLELQRGGHSDGKPLTGVQCEPGFHDRRNTAPQPGCNIPKPLQQVLLQPKVYGPAVQVAMYSTESYRLLIKRPRQLVGENIRESQQQMAATCYTDHSVYGWSEQPSAGLCCSLPKHYGHLMGPQVHILP